MAASTRYNTIQLSLVRDTLFDLADHPSANRVYEAVHQQHPTISKATVYRALNKLVEEGEAQKIRLNDGADRFDHRTHRHYHVRCRICGKVDDIPASFLDDLNEEASRASNYRIDSHDIQFNGVCPHCL